MGHSGDEKGLTRTTAEEVVEGYFRRLLGHESQGEAAWEETDHPPLDIFETESGFIVEVELPGIDMEDLEVSMMTGMLVIAGVKREAPRGKINFLCMERTFGAFRRIVPLLRPVDTSRIKAVFRRGILRIEIPKVVEKRGARKVIPVTKE